MEFCISVREDRIILDTHIHAKRGRGRSLTKMHTSYLFTNTLVFDFFTVITVDLDGVGTNSPPYDSKCI